jgi:HAD superfamily hydrolase (TIGR01509 family)
MTSTQLVIWDNDGVLVDSESLAVRADIELLTGEGLEVTEQEVIDGFLGRSVYDLIAFAEQRLGHRLTPGFRDRFNERLFEMFETELKAVEGVVDVIDALLVPYCVASSGEHIRIENSLRTAGLFDRFEGRIYSAQDVGRGKPHPDLFLYAAGQMEAEPERCIVIEDSEPGVEAALAAKMTVFAYDALTPRARLKKAHAIFEKMSELPALLGPEVCRPLS